MANVLLQIGVMPTKQLPANTGRLFARAPENISEDSVGLRVVATSMSTWLVPGAAAGTETRTPLRVEQPPRVSAKARPTQNLREAEVMTGPTPVMAIISISHAAACRTGSLRGLLSALRTVPLAWPCKQKAP